MSIRNWLLSVFNVIRIRPDRRQRRRLSNLLAMRHWLKKKYASSSRLAAAGLAVAVSTSMIYGTANAQCDGPLFFGQTFGAGDGPRSVTTGDFNGDGFTDLATANDFSGDVSVLLGIGDGTFAAEATFAAGDGPYSVTTGDFNGDGLTDLATANYDSDNVSVLLGNGDGTFAAQQTFGAGNGPRSVTTGDFNGDGLTDLATAKLFR